jgi:hypothetical protein
VKALVVDSGSPRRDPAGRPLRVPVLLLGGPGETGPNRQYGERLRQRGMPVEEAYYPQGEHVATLARQPEVQREATRRTLDFFRQHL